MAFRVHRPESLAWRRIGDIEMGSMREHIDATELEGQLAFHEGGDAETPQLLEMRLNPHTLIAPRSHDWVKYYTSSRVRCIGATMCWRRADRCSFPARTQYSFRTGENGACLLNIRSRDDHNFIPPAAE